MKFFSFIASICCFSVQSSWAKPVLADSVQHYYDPALEFQTQEEFKTNLHRVLNSFHISVPGDFDKIVKTCSKEADTNCYSHIRHGYKKSRQYMFGFLYLLGDKESNYYVTSVYCETDINNTHMPSDKPLGPMLIPDAKVLNAEHSWPQSMFTNAFDKSLQKSDLHALYPVRMKVNSTRGNYPFGEVVSVMNRPCEEAALGRNKNNQVVFEPAEDIKGNIARSLFYFSIRYKIAIRGSEERILRMWHKQDPIDLDELTKHEEVFRIQHVRNPFIDHPEWIEKVQNF